MNGISIIINGVRYDAVPNGVNNDCQDCAFFMRCMEEATCCNFIGGMDGMHFEKAVQQGAGDVGERVAALSCG